MSDDVAEDDRDWREFRARLMQSEGVGAAAAAKNDDNNDGGELSPSLPAAFGMIKTTTTVAAMVGVPT